jgi:hypothetical protein
MKHLFTRSKYNFSFACIIRMVLVFSTILFGLTPSVFATVIIDPNSGASNVTVAYSQSTAGVQFTYTNAGNGTFTLTMPSGVTYIPGSVSFTSSGGAVIAQSNITNLGAPVFSITGATVGSNSIITYGIRSGCATGGGASIGVAVTVGSSTDNSVISITILKASLTVNAHDAAVNFSRGASGTSTTVLTNGGNGSLDSIRFYFKQNGPLVTDSVKANGELLTYIGAVGDTLFYQMSAVHFLGGTLDNGESVTITRYYRLPSCPALTHPNFQSTYMANFGRGGSRCQSPEPTDFGQYNFTTLGAGDPAIAVSIISTIRGATPCQTALIRYRFANTGTGPAALTKLYNIFASTVTFPSNGYKLKSVTLFSNNAVIPSTSANINFLNSSTLQGTDPDALGTGLEDLDGDGYFDDLNAGQSFDFLIEWEYQRVAACSNDAGDMTSTRLQGWGKNICGQDISSGFLPILSGRLRSSGLLLLSASPTELGAGQVGTMQAQVSRTGPNASYLSCATNQWSIRFPLAPGMNVSAIRAGTANLIFTVVSDTVIANIPTTTANPFFCDVDFTVTPGVTPSGVSPVITLAYTCSSTCPNSREDAVCLSGPAIVIASPGLCEMGGATTTNSKIERITTGFTDYTGTARVPLANITPLSRKRGLPCDSVLVTVRGGVQSGTTITGGEPLYYQVSYSLHGGTNRLFQWAGGTYTYQGTSAVLPAPVYEANYSGRHYAIYSLGLYPAGAVVDIQLYGIGQDAATLTNTLEGVAGFNNNFFNLDDGFSNPSPDGGDTRYTCSSQALEFYVRNPRGAFYNFASYDEGGVCNQFTADNRFWYLRGTSGSGSEIDYFPGEVRPIEVLDSIVVTLPNGYSFDPTGAGGTLHVRGNVGDGGFPTSGDPIRSQVLGAPTTIQGQRLVWRNPGNWWIPDDALRGGYGIAYTVKTDCRATGTNCGASVGTGVPAIFYGKTNVNSRNPSCPTAFQRTTVGLSTFGSRPVMTVTNLSGTQNADQKVECFNLKLSVTCRNTPFTYIYFPGGGPTSTFNIKSVTNTTTNVTYPVLQVAGGQWVQFDAVMGDLFFTVCAEYSNCTNPDIPYRISWDCAGYPSDLANSGCTTLTGILDLVSAPSGMQAQFVAQPTNPVSLCQPLVYDFNMLSTLSADLINPRVDVTIPTGMTLNTVQIEYPLNSGNFETVTPAGTTGTVAIPYGLHSAIFDSLPGVNFQTATNPRTARMRLSFTTDCNFTSGNRIAIRPKGEATCGGAAQGNSSLIYSDLISVAGVTQNYVAVVNNLNVGPDTIITCANRTVSMDMVLINTTGSAVTLDPSLDSANIELPTGIQYVPGSYNCTSGANCFIAPIVNANKLSLTFPVPAGITIPASGSVTVSFSIQINALTDGTCNQPGGLTVSMVRSFSGVSCASQSGGICANPVKFITGSKTVQISTKKATIPAITARVCRSSANNYSFNGTFNISNGVVPASQNVQVEVFCLSGGVPMGAPVATQTVNGLLNTASGNIPFSGSFTTTCVGEEFQIRLSPLTDGGTQQCVCSTVSTNVSLSNPTFVVTNGSTCAGLTSVNIPLTSITNSGNQYTVNFDDAAITDITTATNIPVGGVLSLNIPSNLTAGTYTGTVTVINSTTGCSGTAPMSFVVNALPTVDPTVQVCIGNTVTISGSGTPASTNPYLSANTAIATVTSGGVITGVTAGTVNITYTNNLGCTAVSAVTVNSLPTLPNATLCAGSTVTLTGSGTPAAVNPYVSSNTGIATVTSGGQVTGVSAGTTTITYTNNNGCQATATVTINPLPTVSGASSVCKDNTIVLLGSGIPGSTPYSSANTAIATVTSGGQVTGVDAGSTNITYTNINGCQVTASVTVNPTPDLVARDTAICIGGSADLATLFTQDATTATITYYSNFIDAEAKTNALASATVTPSVSSEYFIRKETAAGCFDIDSTDITVNALPSAPTVTLTQPTCSVATGTITVTAPSSGVMYSFDNGLTFQKSNIKSGLAASTTYQVVVKDDVSACISTATPSLINGVLAVPSAPTVTETQPTCSVATGTITVTAPSSGVTYSFDNGLTFQTSNIKSGLAASTTYQVVVKDDVSACISTATPSVINGVLAVPSAPTVTETQPTCSVTTGTITVTAPSSGVTYSFDNGLTFQTSNIKSGLAASTTYQVVVKDDVSACISTATSSVINGVLTVPSVPTVSETQPTCSVTTGTITVTAPSSGVMYSFDNGLTFQSSNIKSGLAASTTYQVVVKDDVSACISTATPSVINGVLAVPSAPTVTLTQPTCSVATGTITVTAPSSGVMYSFDNGLTFQSSNIKSGLAASTTYQVVVKDDVSACISTATSSVINAQPVISTPTLSGTTLVNSCPVTTVNLNSLVTSTEPSGTRLRWHTVATNPTAADSVATPSVLTTAGTYYAYYFDSVNNCYSPATAAVTVTINPMPDLVARDTTFCLGGSANLATLFTEDATSGTITYYTNFTDAQAKTNALASATVTPSLTSEYFIRKETAAGCSDIDSTDITVNPNPEIVGRDTAICIGSMVDLATLYTQDATSGTITYYNTYADAQAKTGAITANITPSVSSEYFFRKELSTGCFSIDTTHIAVHAIPSVTSVTKADPTVVSCPNLDNGSISVTATGAYLRYSKNNGATWQTSSTFNNLIADSYVIRVQDSVAGCFYDETVILVAPSCNQSPVITSPTSVTYLENDNTPAYTITATDPDAGHTKTYTLETGGVDNALFTINNTTGVISFITSPNFELPTDANGNNVYSIKVKVCDNGTPVLCATQDVVITVQDVNECPIPTVGGSTATALTLPICSILNTGSVTLSGHTGKILRWETSTNSGGTWTPIADTTATHRFLNAANNQEYRAVLNNGGTCVNQTSSSTTITTSPVDCCNSCDSTATAIFTAGSTCPEQKNRFALTDTLGIILQITKTPQYSGLSPNWYYIYAVSYDSTLTINGLTVGADIDTLNGSCVEVAVPMPYQVCPSANLVARDTAICAGNGVDLATLFTQDATSGMITYFANFTDAQAKTNALASATVTPSVTSEYFIRKELPTGCFDIDSIDITVNPNPDLVARDTAICVGNSVNLSTLFTEDAVSGTITYFANFTDAQAKTNALVSATVTPSVTSEYFIRKELSTGCFDIDSIDVTVNALPSAPTVTETQPTCSVTTGTITVTAPSSGVMYSFDNGMTYQASNIKSGLAASTTYQVVVKDDVSACVSTATSSIINAQPASPTITTVSKNDPTIASCPALNDGTITVTATGVNLEYSKDNGVTWQASNQFTGLVAGSYTIKVRDNISTCEVVYASNSVVLTAPVCNITPTIISAATATTPENVTPSTVVYTVTATDLNSGQTQTYSFETGGVDNGKFTIDATTGEVKFIASPDFENPIDNGGDNVYDIKIKVCDNGTPQLCAVKDVAITVTDVSDVEICGNQLDDEGDGLIDCEDTADCTSCGCDNTTGDITVTNTGQAATGYTQKYVLTDSTGKILKIETTTTFMGLSSGRYRVYTINYRTSDGITGMTVGGNIGGVTGISVNKSLPVLFKVCVCVTFNVKVFLEGPYQTATTSMQTVLNQRGLLPGQTPIGQFGVATPQGQPYKGAPWNYEGTEGDTITTYPPTVVDWVLLSLRADSLTNTNVFRVTGWLHNDGHISFLSPCFDIANGNYFVVIEHRNHVGVMSPNKVPITNGVLSHDFTVNDSYVIINPPSFGQKQKGSKWVMYAADGKKDTQTTNFDINFNDSQLWKGQSGIFDQYKFGDFNLDADVNFLDSQLWKINNGKYSGIPH